MKQDIILTGDSAGANLCLALIRYLDELGTLETIPNWGMPAGIFLNSVSPCHETSKARTAN